MVDLLVEDGTVVTMNGRREVIEDGAVAVDDGRIVGVGPAGAVRREHDADRTIDASGRAVLPGFVDAHVHVADVLARGIGHGRDLHDWLFNVKRPFVAAMTPEDHRIAAALFCREAIAAGITTFVENAGGTGAGYGDDAVDEKLRVYEAAGMRCAYAHGFVDRDPDDEFRAFVDHRTAKDPSVEHPETPVADTDDALDRVGSLIEAHHGRAEGRITVWPAPYLAGAATGRALRGAYAIAEEHDVMTTTHTAETRIHERGLASSVVRLDDLGYLGERTLLGHCVHLDARDRRLLAESGTKVAHNPLTNLSLGSGVAPVPEMRRDGVTVGIGTDNACQNDTVNVISDMRVAEMVHRGHREDPGAMAADDALAMATIEGARAIGRGDDLGSIEAGKAADLVLLDLDRPHLTPHPDVVSAVVNQARGDEVDAVICDGEVVMEDGRVGGVEDGYPDLYGRAIERADAIRARAGLGGMVRGE